MTVGVAARDFAATSPRLRQSPITVTGRETSPAVGAP